MGSCARPWPVPRISDHAGSGRVLLHVNHCRPEVWLVHGSRTEASLPTDAQAAADASARCGRSRCEPAATFAITNVARQEPRGDVHDLTSCEGDSGRAAKDQKPAGKTWGGSPTGREKNSGRSGTCPTSPKQINHSQNGFWREAVGLDCDTIVEENSRSRSRYTRRSSSRRNTSSGLSA